MAKKKSFETSLAELEQLVRAMESGDMSLDESLKAFEQGVKLTQECQTRLTQAEQRIQTLIADQESLRPQPLDEMEG